MKRVALILAAVVTLAPGGTARDAQAHDGRTFSLGFHSVEAPVGIRYWLSGQKVGLDLGLGFASEPAGIDPNEKENRYGFEFGLPLVVRSWDRAHALIRPGILYQSEQIGFDADPGTPGLQYDTDSQTTTDFMLEGEAEIFIVDDVSVSAAHGIRFRRFDPGFGADSESSFGTTGSNFTTIGFHVYLFR